MNRKPHRATVTHGCPRRGEYRTRCCDRSVFELDALDRMTTDEALVSCRKSDRQVTDGS